MDQSGVNFATLLNPQNMTGKTKLTSKKYPMPDIRTSLLEGVLAGWQISRLSSFCLNYNDGKVKAY